MVRPFRSTEAMKPFPPPDLDEQVTKRPGRRVIPSRSTLTCCGTLAPSPWRTLARHAARCKHGSTIATSSIRCAAQRTLRGVTAWYRNPHLYQREADKVVNAVLEEIAAAMARGDRVWSYAASERSQ